LSGPAGSRDLDRDDNPRDAATPGPVGRPTVPREPDAIARDYILLALRFNRVVPGIVDGYFGPPDLADRVDAEDIQAPGRLAEDAATLRSRLAAEVREPDRRQWLDLQLAALETIGLARAGDPIPYLEQVRRCFALTPERRPIERFEAAAGRLDALLPGDGSLAARLAAWHEGWTVPPERVGAVVDVLVARFRERARRLFGLPAGEDLRVSLVRDQPWTGYNWYDGGYRSRVEINLDLPLRLPGLVATAAHETYPGHHLEHASKEAALVDGLGRLEASVLLINTPECLISEGLANVGRDFVAPIAELAELLVELAPIADVPLGADAGLLREAASRQGSIEEATNVLDEARVNAALMLHEDLAPRDEVIAYLVGVGRMAPEAAAKRLQFIEHPLWRTYVFVYPEGEALLRRWLESAPAGGRAARFARLLREPLTPPAIEAEIAGAG
jgi:hypothetical protein